ncbi:two-component system sensor histidine kinase NtrB [Haloplanus sp.]|uniref:two-component system sensor histidine kinase NtrB n=1 Tax=Haloplanus sp. TaxID=1961696 RepID=UPI0026390417|nr:PAS domain-containing sensor histidine kinase [Haloplanus sp.]
MNGTRRRLAGAIGVGGIGLALLVARLRLGPRSGTTPVSDVAPIGLALALLVVAGWLPRSELDGLSALCVPAATGALAVVGGLTAFVTTELVPATTVVPTTLLLLNFVSAGGALGLAAGLLAATTWTLHARTSQLRRSRDEYQELFDGIADAVIVHDTRGGVIAANDAATDRLGHDNESLTDRRITDVESGEIRTRAVTDGRIVYETNHTTADGETVPVEVSARRVRYRGAPVVLSVARDISRRRASERQLSRTHDRLRALNRVLRHDIRNDMQIVLGTARLLGDHLDDEAARAHLQRITDTGEHVVELTKSSRDLERTLSAETVPSLHPVSLTETIESELDRCRSAFDHATFDIDGDLPDTTVRANDLLSSVFRNLLNNAVQHNDREQPTVAVSGERRDGRVVIRVADDGPGIPPAQRRSAFEKNEAGFDSRGTGLGLYLVSTLVDQYGGDVWVEDNDPRGTVIAVQLWAEPPADGTVPDGVASDEARR